MAWHSLVFSGDFATSPPDNAVRILENTFLTPLAFLGLFGILSFPSDASSESITTSLAERAGFLVLVTSVQR